MVSGRPPFRASSALAVLKRVAEEPPRPIQEIIPETPDWLCGIITKLHAKNPDDRFQSAREVADLLADCEAKLKAKQEVKNVLPAAVKPAGRKWVAAAAVFLLPVIALAVTEFAGVTQLFRQQATPDSIKPGGGPTPGLVAKHEPPPLAVAPFDAAQAKKYQEAWAKHLGVDVETTNAIGMKLRVIPPGRFPMRPDRRVTISKPFLIAAHETTIAQFQKFVDETKYRTSAEKAARGTVVRMEGAAAEVGPEFTWQHKDVAGGDDYPVGQLSWDDAVEFCQWLSRKEGKPYRLPTDAEWEWACRAGSVTEYHFDHDKESLDEYAWYAANSGGRSHPVGQKKPNRWGLYDMQGNIAEFCLDWCAALEAGDVVDPTGPAGGETRVIRSFAFFSNILRISQRGFSPPGGSMNHFGFRVVCESGPLQP